MNVFDLRSQRWHLQESGDTFGNEVRDQSIQEHTLFNMNVHLTLQTHYPISIQIVFSMILYSRMPVYTAS